MKIKANGIRLEVGKRGRHDALVPIACGRDTARRISGARFRCIEGMDGHDLAPGAVEQVLAMLPQLGAGLRPT